MWVCWLAPFWNFLHPQPSGYPFGYFSFSLSDHFPPGSLVDSCICLLNIIIPKLTNLGLLHLSLDILFLGDHKVSIIIYMQMPPKSLISSLNLSCLCVCNYVTLYLKTSAVSSLLQQICLHCHCTLPYPHCMYLPIPLSEMPIHHVLLQTKLLFILQTQLKTKQTKNKQKKQTNTAQMPFSSWNFSWIV